jgi:hypothetical protein
MLPQGGNRNDDGILAALALPLLDGLLAPLATSEKDVDRHDEGEPVNANVHLSIEDFVVGDFPHVTRQIGHTRLLSSRILSPLSKVNIKGLSRPKTEQSKAGVESLSPAKGGAPSTRVSLPILSIVA